MKRKHTTARRANRASSFQKTGSFGTTSAKRHWLRAKPRAKTFGEHIVRLQAICKGVNQFGIPRYKFVAHSAQA